MGYVKVSFVMMVVVGELVRANKRQQDLGRYSLPEVLVALSLRYAYCLNLDRGPCDAQQKTKQTTRVSLPPWTEPNF